MNPRSACFLSFIIFTFLISLSATSQEFDKRSISKVSTNDDVQKININNIEYRVSNNGIGVSILDNGFSGGFFWFPENSSSFIFSDGFVWTGKVIKPNRTQEIYGGGSSYRASLHAGPIITNGKTDNGNYQAPIASNPNDPKYRIYKIQKNWKSLPDSNPDKTKLENDFLNWPKEDGAPVTLNGDPEFLGDQTLYFVCNDMDAARTNQSFGSSPIGLEIQTTMWAYKTAGLNNSVFIRKRFINKSGLTIDSMMVGIFSDPDIGDASNDLVGCDSTLQMCFGYNNPYRDYYFPSVVPSVGYSFFQTPTIFGNKSDTAFTINGMIPGKKNLKMKSFFFIKKGGENYESDMNLGVYKGTLQLFHYMQGLKENGSPQLDERNQPTLFPLNGDPETENINIDRQGYDKRLFMSVEPFTFLPGDTQDVVVVITVAQGNSNKNSVTQVKNVVKNLKLNQSIAEEFNSISFSTTHKPDNMSSELIVNFTTRNKFENVTGKLKPMFGNDNSIPLQFERVNNSDFDWNVSKTVQNLKYPQLVELSFTLIGTQYHIQLSDYLKLRPSPVIESIKLVNEDFYQDNQLDFKENAKYKLIFQNIDKINGIDSMSLFSGISGNFAGFSTKSSSVEFSIFGSRVPTVSVPFYKRWDHFISADTVLIATQNRIIPLLRDSLITITGTPQSRTDYFSVKINDPTLLTGQNYNISFFMNGNSVNGKLKNAISGLTLADSLSLSEKMIVLGEGINFFIHDQVPGCTNYTSSNFFTSWVSGQYFEYKNIYHSGVMNAYEFQNNCSVKDTDYISVRIDFAEGEKISNPDQWGQAYMYKINADSIFEFIGVGDVPFKVWDTKHNHQLNVCTRDDGDLVWNMGWNGTSFPDMKGANEYIYIMNSSYHIGNDYNTINKGPDADVLYFFWPKRSYKTSHFLSSKFSIYMDSNPINKPGDELYFNMPKKIDIPEYKNNKSVLFYQNYPNPFNPETKIKFLIANQENVLIEIYNELGQLVKTLVNKSFATGEYVLSWDGKNDSNQLVSSGLYIYRIHTKSFSQTKKMLLIK